MRGLTAFSIWSYIYPSWSVSGPFTTPKTDLVSFAALLSSTPALRLKQLLCLYTCLFWAFHKWRHVSGMLWLASFISYTVFKAYLVLSYIHVYITSFLFSGQIIFHCVDMPHLFIRSPFDAHLALLLKHLDQGFYRHSCRCFCLNTYFIYLFFLFIYFGMGSYYVLKFLS